MCDCLLNGDGAGLLLFLNISSLFYRLDLLGGAGHARVGHSGQND